MSILDPKKSKPDPLAQNYKPVANPAVLAAALMARQALSANSNPKNLTRKILVAREG